jgi:hypothetical protein
METFKAVFAMYDKDGSGYVDTKEMEQILEKIGRDPAQATELLKSVDPDRSGTLSFDEFVGLVRSADLGATRPAGEGDDELIDPKVAEFLRILDEYRLKCEEEGNYLEAGRAAQQSSALRKQEEKRQQRALRARQLAERQDVQIAHNMQYAEFNAAWDKYMQEYDQMAAMYIKQMDEKHAAQLKGFQQQLHSELTKRPPKFSRELLDWRKRQQLLAKQGKYAEAQKIKKVADELERRERMKMDEDNLRVFQQKEGKFRSQQQGEMSALLKRIDARRREHLKQRELDSKRLLQRNRNVQQVLENKQNVELNKVKTEIRSALNPSTHHAKGRETLDTGAGPGGFAAAARKKKLSQSQRSESKKSAR